MNSQYNHIRMENAMLKNKILLIIGGTGLFGSAVLKRFINLDLQEIRIFFRDESKQVDTCKRIKLSSIKLFSNKDNIKC